MPSDRRLAGALGVMIAAALLLGATTGTLTRHLIEITPALLVLAAVARQRRWATWAAMPVAVFWLVITAITGMAELGLVPRMGGPYTTLHIALLATLAIAAVLALAAAALVRSTATIAARLGAFWLFALLQLGALLAGLRLH